ncbi:MAG TPA: LytTR family DNA-binding domain-containing protein [Candidatus Methylomirabilis sp.]|nr:LytTR family DNA-binding domain-containing protein [Candidatus Methylomirabilis sp.]
MRIRTLIVDDEPLGRERIRHLLAGDPEIEVAGECSDGRQAIAAIGEHKPDLVFLDVQMPEVDGFGVLDEICGPNMPTVIFVTAYDRYAVRAFEVHALDYLLKSFDQERFREAVRRAKEEIGRARQGELNERLAGLIEDLEARKERVTRLVIKSGGRVVFLRVEEIDWIEAADNYVRVHAGRETHLIREKLQAMERRLDPAKFLRIHRSSLVNLDRIRELQPAFHGDYVVKLIDGTELTLSRNYREKLVEPLGHFL